MVKESPTAIVVAVPPGTPVSVKFLNATDCLEALLFAHIPKFSVPSSKLPPPSVKVAS